VGGRAINHLTQTASTGTLISVEDYLNTSFSPDCHYVGGALVERNGGEKEHGRIQRALIRYLAKYRSAGLEAWPEQRIQISPDHYRVVDVCITEGEPEGQIFVEPPLVCIEILSRNDTLDQLQEVIDDYAKIGVPYIWIINPWKHIAYVGSPAGFVRVSDGIFRTASPHPDVMIPLDELYSL
jgi:Uma2 family endonuclease